MDVRKLTPKQMAELTTLFDNYLASINYVAQRDVGVVVVAHGHAPDEPCAVVVFSNSDLIGTATILNFGIASAEQAMGIEAGHLPPDGKRH